jgi:hypothetical protein
VERHLQGLTEGLSVLHLFGGKSSWGVRLDIDPQLAPDVIGDAWVPPFKRDSFDVVILDPPYVHFSTSEIHILLRSAAWCARKLVIWFSTLWVDQTSYLRYVRGWLCRLGDRSVVRCLEVFEPIAQKALPLVWVEQGPAIKCNRWMGGQYKLL